MMDRPTPDQLATQRLHRAIELGFAAIGFAMITIALTTIAITAAYALANMLG